MQETQPPPEGESEQAEIDMPGAWIFAMLADLKIGPTSEEIESETGEK